MSSLADACFILGTCLLIGCYIILSVKSLKSCSHIFKTILLVTWKILHFLKKEKVVGLKTLEKYLTLV